MNIGDIFFAFRGTDGGLQVDAQKAAEAAGVTFGTTFSSKLKTAVAGGIGALAGAGLASAISGATKLNELAGDYQVQTGANAAEAKQFSGILNELFKNAHQSYDEIATTLIGLKTHFDISGQAAATLAANILDFAEITGGTGADAVERLNSLVKTGVIAEGDMVAVMDKLTLAHQTWGININETLDSLVKFAPAMNAFGMTTDQAIAWMSIFNKAGVDSQRVVMGFNTALQKVKSPEEFNALVAQIAATPDDLERAKLAVSLFGARAGGALANMLRPGTQSIADMAAVIGTDYTGAVEKAAAVNDSTFGGQALLMLHKFQGALADLGTNMGELLLVFALVGPRITTALLAGLGGLGGLLIPKITQGLVGAAGVEAWMTTGTKIGTLIGGAIGPALTIAAVAAVVMVWDSINKQLNEQAAAVGTRLTEVISSQTMDQLTQDKLAIGKGISDILNMPFGGLIYGDQIRALQAQLDQVNAAIIAKEEALYRDSRAPGAAVVDGITDGITDGTPKAIAAMKAFVNDVGSVMAAGFARLPMPADKVMEMFGGATVAAVKKAAAHTGIEGMLALAAGITSARQAPLDAFDAMVAMLKTPMTSTQELARLAGELTSQSLADGLRSHDPEIHAQAIAVKREILDRLEELQTAKGIGSAAMDELVKGLDSKDPEIRKAAQTAYDAVIDRLNATKGAAGTAGANAGTAFGDRFTATIRAKLTAIGINVGVGSGLPGSGRAEGGSVRAGMPYIVGERRPELFVPQTNGYILPSVPTGRGVSVNIEHVEIRDAHDEFSLTQQLRFLASVG